MQGYVQEVQTLAAQGAKFIVLPEMTAVVVDSLSPRIDALFQQTAHAAGAQVLLGVLHVTNRGTFNEAAPLLFPPELSILSIARHHLVPCPQKAAPRRARRSPCFPSALARSEIEICRDMDLSRACAAL